MTRTEEEKRLARQVATILRSDACSTIRFRLDKVLIQTYMYVYIAGSAEQDVVKVRIGNPHPYDAKYDPASNQMTFRSPSVGYSPDGEETIVHESTHAVVDATFAGYGSGAPRVKVSHETNELVAYIAQTIYAINRGFRVNKVGPLGGPVFELATKVREFNRKHSSGPSFDCTSPTAEAAKGELGMMYRAANGLAPNAALPSSVIDGIGDGPRRSPMVPD